MSARGRTSTAVAVRARAFVSVGTKLAIMTVLVLLGVACAVYHGLTSRERASLMSAKQQAGAMVSQLFAASTAAAVDFDDTDGVAAALEDLALNPEVVHAVVWKDASSSSIGGGEVGLDALLDPKDGSEPNFEVVPNDPGTPVVMGEYRHPQYDDRPDVGAPEVELGVHVHEDRVTFATPVANSQGEPIGRTLVELSLAGENAEIEAAKKRTLITSCGIAALVACVLVMGARRLVVRPLDDLVAAAASLEAGERVAVEINANDEVGRLARAFASMAMAIDARETEIQSRNADMRLVLDNVEQGFVTLERGGTMAAERSRAVDEWFGASGDGETFWTYIARTDESAAAWFELAWGPILDGLLPLEVSLDQLPKRVHDDSRVFAVAYTPILDDDGELDKLVVVITDITAQIESERAEREQTELLEIFRQVTRDRAGFVAFWREAGGLAACMVDPDPAEAKTLFRSVHTLKGNCATFGLGSIAECAHELEGQLAAGRFPAASSWADLSDRWNAIAERVSVFLDDKASVIEIGMDEYQSIVSAIERGVPYKDLAAVVADLRHEPAQRSLERVGRTVNALARRLGKGDPEVRIETDGVRLPANKWAPFLSSLVHVARNGIDHGIESPNEREAAGKGPPKITLRARRDGSDVVLEFEDDGRGVAWERVRERAMAAGLPARSLEDLAEALFADGFSTARSATEISGRGVGLAAVRAACDDLGGRIRIDSRDGRGTRFEFRIPRYGPEAPRSPSHAELQVSRSSDRAGARPFVHTVGVA